MHRTRCCRIVVALLVLNGLMAMPARAVEEPYKAAVELKRIVTNKSWAAYANELKASDLAGFLAGSAQKGANSIADQLAVYEKKCTFEPDTEVEPGKGKLPEQTVSATAAIAIGVEALSWLIKLGIDYAAKKTAEEVEKYTGTFEGLTQAAFYSWRSSDQYPHLGSNCFAISKYQVVGKTRAPVFSALFRMVLIDSQGGVLQPGGEAKRPYGVKIEPLFAWMKKGGRGTHGVAIKSGPNAEYEFAIAMAVEAPSPLDGQGGLVPLWSALVLPKLKIKQPEGDGAILIRLDQEGLPPPRLLGRFPWTACSTQQCGNERGFGLVQISISIAQSGDVPGLTKFLAKLLADNKKEVASTLSGIAKKIAEDQLSGN